LCNVLELTESDTRLRSRPKMESKAAEASGKSAEQRRAERRQKAVIGPLPDSFLRIPGPDEEPMTAEERDREMAVALQRQMALEAQGEGQAGAAIHGSRSGRGVIHAPGLAEQQNVVGRLTITVVEAKLTKNYGVTRMDPYARLRVGHNVYETPTCQNGSKEPKWNKTINCFLMVGARSIDVEIYDECTFSPDALIAHTSVPVTDSLLTKGEMVDDWWPLSGQEGEEKEGLLHLILSLQPLPPGSAVRIPAGGVAPSLTGGPPLAYTPTHLPVEQAKPQPPPQLVGEELEEFCKMFPAIDRTVIQAVFVENQGNKETTVTSLLQMGS